MSRAVLANTGPLYALADLSDQFPARAVSELAAFDKRGLAVAVSHSVLCESYTLVLRRPGAPMHANGGPRFSQAPCY
jgi:hypothetical protein